MRCCLLASNRSASCQTAGLHPLECLSLWGLLSRCMAWQASLQHLAERPNPLHLLCRLQFTEGAAWPPSRHSMAEPSRLSSLPRIDSARAMTQADELGGHPLSRVPTWEALADAARQLEESRRQLNLPSPTGAAPGMSFHGLGSL